MDSGSTAGGALILGVRCNRIHAITETNSGRIGGAASVKGIRGYVQGGAWRHWFSSGKRWNRAYNWVDGSLV